MRAQHELSPASDRRSLGFSPLSQSEGVASVPLSCTGARQDVTHPGHSLEQVTNLLHHLDSTAVWTGTDERLAMKEMIGHLDDPERAWRTFLEFDANMTRTISNQAAAFGSPVVSRSPSDKVFAVADRVAAALGLEPATDENGTDE